MKDTQRAFGDALKKRRAKLGLTREQLSKLTGITISNLQIYESGCGNPTLFTICKLTDVLGWRFTVHPKRNSGTR